MVDGLLAQLGQELAPAAGPGPALEDQLDDFWLEHPRLGPLQRWLRALHQVVLVRVPGRIVIFIDEIDAVRSLPFSTDEFFAGIRECYNRRTREPEFGRLTFCLLGVASPSDLIRDVRTTPFNIGRRIELTDFTEAEAAPLAEGLGRKEPIASRLSQRVLHWTGGHPYLTQRLCRAVAEDSSVADPAGVDRLCEELFLSPRARERDDNLLFVREQMLRSETDLAGLLGLYEYVWRGKRVADDETNPGVTVLRLSGATRSEDGVLRLRNRIYAKVFDRAWVRENMPDAELRRQKSAYRRGLLRAAAVSGMILAVVGGLALTAMSQARRANRLSRFAIRQQRLAEIGAQESRRQRYAAQVKLAQQAIEAADAQSAQSLLAIQRPHPGEEDLRGFEWGYLWRLSEQDDARSVLDTHQGPINAVAFSPNGRLLASAGNSWSVKVWEVASKRQVANLPLSAGETISLAFSPDGSLLAAGKETHGEADSRGEVRLWNTTTWKQVARLLGPTKPVLDVAFSPGGGTLVAAAGDETVTFWEVATCRRLATRRIHERKQTGNMVAAVTFSPDGRLLATTANEENVRLWDAATRRELAVLPGHRGQAMSLAFSPDGRYLAAGTFAHMVKL